MHRHEGNAKPAGHRTVPNCSLQLGEQAYITTGCGKNFRKIAL